MKIPAIVAALPCICLMAIIARAETTCSVAEKLSCAQGQGCQSVNNSIIIRLDEQQKVYSRCDAKGCDDYPAQFTLSGAFINIDVSGHGMLAKLSADGTFTEVVTLGTAVLVSFGSCR